MGPKGPQIGGKWGPLGPPGPQGPIPGVMGANQKKNKFSEKQLWEFGAILGTLSWIFGPETVTFGPRDQSGWFWGAILLRIGGLGPQNDGLRLREGTFRPFGPWNHHGQDLKALWALGPGPMAQTLRPFGRGARDPRPGWDQGPMAQDLEALWALGFPDPT